MSIKPAQVSDNQFFYAFNLTNFYQIDLSSYDLSTKTGAKKYLFAYNSCSISKLSDYFHSYKHEGDYQSFDHDTFHYLPDEIIGLNHSYHLKKDYVVLDQDMMGYSSWFFENEEGTEINALQNFYLSIYRLIELHNTKNSNAEKSAMQRESYYGKKKLKNYFAVELFYM